MFSSESIIEKLDKQYKLTYITNDNNSWILEVKNFINVTEDELENFWKECPDRKKSINIFGRIVQLPRFIENYGIDYYFSGKMFTGKQLPKVYENIINELKQLIIDENNNSMLNNCLINYYRDGDDYIGPHSDAENSLYENSPIITFTIGCKRRFKLSLKDRVEGTNLDLNPENGTLIIMGGTTQKTHLHSLPKTKRCKTKRISITMRCIKSS